MILASRAFRAESAITSRIPSCRNSGLWRIFLVTSMSLEAFRSGAWELAAAEGSSTPPDKSTRANFEGSWDAISRSESLLEISQAAARSGTR